ncbi:MAG: hypothetical protein JW976_04830 [Syntrophaceae bacterium]|nr:hypothetical protein [Syntrophaceae bacterium]
MKKLSFMMLIIFIMLVSLVLPAGTTYADEETDPPVGDESATFASVAADALIVLDLSGSMAFGPPGSSAYYGSSASCAADTTNCTGTGCSDGFCGSSKTNCSVNCSRLAIAKKGLFGILDDDNSNTIDSSDSDSLGIRIGFMRFKATNPPSCDNGNDTSGNYASGGIKLITKISELGEDTGTSYSRTYCGNSTSCASTVTSCSTGECIAGENACGGTPLASALKEAKSYLDDHKNQDNAKECRQKFVILLTDGADTYACGGAGNECQQHMYKRRREVVAATAALFNAGYKVFVIGFGSAMPSYLINTLEWAAYYGGTDNLFVPNSGDLTAYNIPDNETFPVGVSSCASSSDSTADCCRDNNSSHTCDGVSGWTSQENFKTTTNDPGYLALSGYAFIATNATELSDALRAAIATIKDQAYSFTRVSVQTIRTQYENYIYEASFLPLIDAINDPFWIGYLKRYSLKDDGSLEEDFDWDAGAILRSRSGSSRTIYTCKGGNRVSFNTVTAADLGVDTAADPTATRNGIVNFIYNGELDTAYAHYGWKLGDIFHSSPISIGSPSPYFSDVVDEGTTPQPDGTIRDGFDAYRDAHERSSALGNRLLIAGANDGQLHVFKTGESSADGGKELWSFIPPNLLTKLQGLYHTEHPTSLSHQYFVDGPATASDIWTGAGDGKSKLSTAWRAYMIIGEGRGGSSTLWSSSPHCDSGFNSTYSTVYKNHCGYYAFDVTETLSAPEYKWHFGGTAGLTATQGNHLGQPWSKITIGRVYINGDEKWVGFTAGGFASTNCKTANDCSACDKRGKGFYVIDLLYGTVLWTYTACGPDGIFDFDNMQYSLVTQPASVDSDDDGFIDTVYVPDLGGNIWRFKMCTDAQKTADASCGIGSWTGGKFYEAQPGVIRPIYIKPTVTRTLYGDLLVYWGSGDVTDPTAANAQEKIYACKDNDRTTTWHQSDLENITSGTYAGSNNGWYINLTGQGEKILADPTVYADIVYFTSYTPGDANDPCNRSGQSKLWALHFLTGAGQFENGERTTDAGTGIASGPVVSENPHGGTNIYVTTSEGAQINVLQPPDPTANRANLQYWHDMRVQ